MKLLHSSFCLLPFFRLPHDDAKHTGDAWINYVTSHITTIGEIEKVTGIDFLPGVTGTKRTAVENFKAPALWPKE